MTSLLSLVTIKRKAFVVPHQVPSNVRLKAAREIRHAVESGRVSREDLAAAMAGGDAGIAALMCRKHALHSAMTMPSDGLVMQWTPEPDTIASLMAWARSLREAGRLSNDVLAPLSPEDAFHGLMSACSQAAQAPEQFVGGADKLPYEYQVDPLFHVATTFTEALTEPSGRSREQEPAVLVEPMYLPAFDVPTCADPDDATALRSALSAIGRAEMFGMWIEPRHLPWVVDGWFVESLEDIGRKTPFGTTPVVTDEDMADLEEMFGFGFDGSEGAAIIAAHINYLRSLNKVVVWKPGSAAMKNWLQVNSDSRLGALVDKLLGIATRIKRIKLTSSEFEIDSEGDPTAILLMESTDPEASYFFNNMSEFGSQEAPLKRIYPIGDAAQNPSLFWKLHDSVVLVASLLTDAAHALQSYKNESTCEPCIAA